MRSVTRLALHSAAPAPTPAQGQLYQGQLRQEAANAPQPAPGNTKTLLHCEGCFTWPLTSTGVSGGTAHRSR